MNEPPVDILILDAHGVVFNNPFTAFLSELAHMTNQRSEDVLGRWRAELRAQAWTGTIDDEELWQQLTGKRGDPECWQALLETHYTLGPVAPILDVWSQRMPIWILSNHRTHWLHRRLDRFGLTSLFERVIVSEDLQRMKPDKRLFQMVADQLPNPKRALFIDDQQRNVDAATGTGFLSRRVDVFIGSQQEATEAVFASASAPCSDIDQGPL